MWRVMDIMGVKFRPPKYSRAASSESLSRMTAMSSIAVRSICGFVQLLVFLGVVLFAPAWTIGSWWGILMALPMVFVLVLRILDEEKFLRLRLPGYTDYCRRVK